MDVTAKGIPSRSSLGALAGLCLPALLAAAPAPPSWVTGAGADPGQYPAARFLTGYGVAGPAGTAAQQREEALAMAREAVAASLRTRVTSEFTSRVTQVDAALTRFARNLVRTRADLELEGLDTFLTWRDEAKGVTHVLAVLDRARTLQILAPRLEREAQDCRKAFEAGDPERLILARQARVRLEEGTVVASVLSAGAFQPPAAPALADIDGALRKAYRDPRGLDGVAALAALDLGAGLPRGIRVLVDRVTYQDTPFCGTFSSGLERALAGRLVRLGQVEVLDKAAGREALLGGGLEAGLAASLRSQAVIRGTCREAGGEVRLDLRATSLEGEELAASSLAFPRELLVREGLRLAPDNLEDAAAALAVANAQVQATALQVKAALDRGDGGIYRKGDRLHVFVQASRDCHLKVLYRQVDGKQVVIFPNRYHPDAFVRKGELCQIPPGDGTFEWVVQEPFGVEMLKVLACTEPIPLDESAPDAQGMRDVKAPLQDILARTRGIRLQKAEAQYAEATLVVNTMAK